MAKINWQVEITERFVEMPPEHIPVYMEAQRIILNLVLEALRKSREELENTYLGANHAKVN